MSTSAERQAVSRSPSPLTGTVAAASRLSVAVLPIATIGGTPEDAYFGEGLTEELTLALSRLEGLRVVSRTSAASFRGQSLSLSAIAAQLGVEFVLEASVRRAGERLRFSAKLIRASEDSPLWSDTFDRTVSDVFALQDEITSRVVDTIAGALQLGKLRGQVPVAATRTLEAYDLYLLGRHHWSDRSEAGMRRARELFQQAAGPRPLVCTCVVGTRGYVGRACVVAVRGTGLRCSRSRRTPLVARWSSTSHLPKHTRHSAS
jgi:TolB-like protein